ncbi:DUF4233 domain-containing protein [Planosporangium flavigriseum]|uniref:DUF4233 domain-containing protein n=1 Tax=Planosporangium flavigriseum TaxID=373681 RepID=A0A8J3PPK2_9ACTN|nr:DUF4233 domain-containing protein [Planosporangium flavigriseum]NJC66510.1 DUF4233 domain-containing protein [Planosporangium flavigriseum]GIG76459.1 hypothetical protein Pfl04_48630 [Planosporangium flavigriseum]
MSESKPGLRNPAAAVRGAGAGTLAVEAIVLLLAIAPLAKIGGAARGPAIVLVLVLAVAAVLLAGLLRHTWAWWAGLVVPVGLLAGGALHWSLAALGVVFGLLWAYVLNVRRAVYANRPS